MDDGMASLISSNEFDRGVASEREFLDAGCGIEILSFSAELREHFKTINAAWINEMFTIEATDLAVLDQPEKLLAGGGHIWFARASGLGVVGTCALLHSGPGAYELTKMGVLKEARGLGIGGRLLSHVLGRLEELGVRDLYLLTNSRCESAIALYRKYGFADDAEVMARYASKYQRCEIAMRYQRR